LPGAALFHKGYNRKMQTIKKELLIENEKPTIRNNIDSLAAAFLNFLIGISWLFK